MNRAGDTVLNNCGTMSYDDMNRLTARTSTGGTALNDSWSYDRWGNRWTQAAAPGGFSGQLTFNTGTNQAVGYGYDAAGNLLSDTINTYSYDAGNRRVRSDIYGSAAELVYDLGGRKVAILQAGSGNVIEQDLHLLLPWGTQPLAVFQNGVFSYEHQDWLGTERLLTDGSGNTAGSYGSLPFGDNFSQSGADVDPYHFAGLDHDYESGLDHAQFREYSSAGGRWLSPDPYQGSYDSSNPQSLNRYSYVLNDPLSQTDPTGQFTNGAATAAGCAGFGPIGCVIGAGIDLGLGAALGDILHGIFGGGPSFHGSLKPRPNAQPWDEYNITYGPNIAGALGLPDATCEFGACGGPIENFQNGTSASGPGIFDKIETSISIFVNVYLYGKGVPYNDPADPNLRLFGTHYCGPGGAGPITNKPADPLCYEHDACLARNGLDFRDERRNLPNDLGNQLQACNQALCNTAGKSNSLSAQTINGFFHFYGNYTCH